MNQKQKLSDDSYKVKKPELEKFIGQMNLDFMNSIKNKIIEGSHIETCDFCFLHKCCQTVGIQNDVLNELLRILHCRNVILHIEKEHATD